MLLYPIGTVLKLKDDYPSDFHEVYGYEVSADNMSLLFKDGMKLSISRIDLIEEVA